MAQFNPPIQPTNDPNYENRSRPVDIPDSIRPRGVEANQILPKGQEIGDKSAEYTGKAAGYAAEAAGSASKGYGDLFAGVVGIGDFMAKAGVSMVKKDIEDKVYEVANNERMRYTAELENLKASGGAKSLLDSNAQMSEDIPDEIAELPETLNTLQGAEHAGKLSKTGYNGRLLAAAKDLRARYPGFKNEIDLEFAKVTGVNPANAYITGLVRDINVMNSSQNSEKNKLLGYIRGKAGFEGSEEAYRNVEIGRWGGNEVVKWAAPQERFRLELSDRAAVFNDKKLSLDDRKMRGGELLDKGLEGIVNTHVSSFVRSMGLDTPENAEVAAARTQNGEITPKAWGEHGQRWADAKLKLREAMYTDAQRQGLTQVVGLDKVTEKIDAAMKRMDAVGDRIFNHDSGGVYRTAQQIKLMGDQDQKDLLNDSIVGTDFRAIDTIKRIGGDNYLQSENLRKIVDGLSGRYANYQERWKNHIQSQNDMITSGVPVTLNRMFDEFKVKMKDATDTEKRKMNSSMINEITRITDPTVPDNIKENYAYTAFHPNNLNFISRLNIDGKDVNGRDIEGQNAVFQKFTSPEMTKEMKRLGQAKPVIWENYVNWTQETLGKELIGREINGLSQIRNPAIKVGWDSDNKRLVPRYEGQLETVRGRPGLTGGGVTTTTGSGTDTEWGIVQRAVNRINSNLNNFKNVAEASGGNVDSFMLGSIVKIAGPQALSQVDNIPGDIMRQIGLTQLKKKR